MLLGGFLCRAAPNPCPNLVFIPPACPVPLFPVGGAVFPGGASASAGYDFNKRTSIHSPRSTNAFLQYDFGKLRTDIVSLNISILTAHAWRETTDITIYLSATQQFARPKDSIQCVPWNTTVKPVGNMILSFSLPEVAMVVCPRNFSARYLASGRCTGASACRMTAAC